MASSANSNFLTPAGVSQAPIPGGSSLSCCSKEGVCISVGVLGHVDSGKTSICRALSHIISTCGLDKHPQSKERGITLDLGFSAFPLTLTVNPHHCHVSEAPANAAADTPASSDAQEAPVDAKPQAGKGCAGEDALREQDRDGRKLQEVQICLVDCPGHASLVRTVIGGSHIIDVALLVVDACKGVQAQTAECIVICQVIKKPLLVVLNKIDLIPQATRHQKVASLTTKMQRLLEGLGFGPAVPVVALSAAPSANEGGAYGIETLKEALAGLLVNAPRGSSLKPLLQEQTKATEEQKGRRCLLLEALDRQRCSRCLCCLQEGFAGREVAPLLFLSDHAFTMKGKGTVVTGTVLRGRVAVGDTLTLLSSATAGVVAPAAKVKGIQRFRKDSKEARAGQRAAVCLSGIDASHVERGILASPGAIPPVFRGCIASVRLIKIFHLPNPTKAENQQHGLQRLAGAFNTSLVYEESKCLTQESPEAFALLSFERPVLAPMGSLLLGSRLDMEESFSTCRLAIEGCIVRPILLPHAAPGNTGSAGSSQPPGKEVAGSSRTSAPSSDVSKGCAAAPSPSAVTPLPLAALRVVRRKWRVGIVERFAPDGTPPCVCGSTTPDAPPGVSSNGGSLCGFRSRTLVVRGLFKDAQHARRFAGFRVALLQTSKEEAEQQLERGEGGALYQACLSICLSSFATAHSAAADSTIIQTPEATDAKSGCTAGEHDQAVRACPEEDEKGPVTLARPGLLSSAFGGKGKCHVDLVSPLSCAETAGAGGLGTSQFCVALIYCKSCFDKHQPLLQP